MNCWIEGCFGFKHAVSDMEALTHHGADGDHRQFTAGKQTVAIPLAPVSLIKGHHGWHVQSLAQARMADLGQARLAIDARARLVLAGIEAGKSLHRAGIVKARRLTEKASKVAMVRSPKPGAVEQVAFIFEIRIDPA